MRKPALRSALALLLALCLLCPGLAAAADGGDAQSMPVYIDGLLSARAYVSGETVFLPPETVCAAAGMSMSWSEDNGTLTLSVPGAVLTGHKGTLKPTDGIYTRRTAGSSWAMCSICRVIRSSGSSA